MRAAAARPAPTAARALAFLALRSAANRAGRAMRRLRDPRYLIALLAGLAYFGWIGVAMLRGGGRGEAAGRAAQAYPWLAGVAPLGLVLLAAIWWATGRFHRALAFSPAEAHSLFSAPLSRRQLILYKLVCRQPGVVFTGALASLYGWAVGVGAGGAGGLARIAVGLWIVITTLQLHQIAASLVRTAAVGQGRAGLHRQWPALLLLAVVLGAVAAALLPALPAVLAAETVGDALVRVEAALSGGAAAVALAPPRWLLSPLFAETGGAWLAALPGAVVVLALHLLWVLRSDAAFEEGAAEAGRAQAKRLRAFTEGRGGGLELTSLRRLPRPWFRLKPTGHPAVAILWKNLTLAARQLRPATVALFAAVFAGAYLFMRVLTGDPREAAVVCMAMAFAVGGMMIVGGSLGVRNDLRTDLRKLDLLRTYPLRGREVVAAEVAAATVLLTAVQVLFLAVGLGFLLLGFPALKPWWAPGAGAVAMLLLLPPLNALMIGAQNALAVLFPAWTRIGSGHPGGVEQMGTLMLTLLGTLLFLAVALVPALAVALSVGFPLRALMGVWAAFPAALAGWLVLCSEAVLLAVLLGDRYDALDPAEAGLLE